MPIDSPETRAASSATAEQPGTTYDRRGLRPLGPLSDWARLVHRELQAIARAEAANPGAAAPPDPATAPEPAGRAGQAAESGTASATFEMLAHPPRDLFGLALSGGGIRSATFNLGLLQALNEVGLLRAFDYLSTVSGGGYVGAWWTAWRTRSAARGELFPRRAAQSSEEPGPIRHLREYSNFLGPRLGLLSYDTGRIIITALAGLLPAFVAALAVIVLLEFLWLGFAAAFFAYGVSGVQWDSRLALVVSSVAFIGLSVGTLGVTERYWRRRGEVPHKRAYTTAAAFGVALALVTWLLFHGLGLPAPYATLPVPVIGDTTPSLVWLSLLAPAAAWCGAVAILAFVRAGLSRVRPQDRQVRATYDRVSSRLLFLAAGWTAMTLVWYGGVALWSVGQTASAATATGVAGFVAVMSEVFRRIRGWSGMNAERHAHPSLLTRLRPQAPRVVAYAVVLALFCATAAVIVLAVDRGQALMVGGLALLTVLATLFLVEPNETGLHGFYRARLARAYLGASNPDGGRRTEEQAGDDLPLDAVGEMRPLPLFCSTANDLTALEPLSTLHRGAVSAVLSPVGFTVGNAAADWDRWTDPAHRVTVGTAMTASAAAFNSQMGGLSMQTGPAVSFLMTALNLRLGIWLPHPRHVQRGKALRAALPGRAFYHELFGVSRADGDDVHLSDGGHFENMALYELIRRHCRFVLASDCGADPTVAFDDFGNLVRRVREDFGVEIDIDLDPLRPGADGLARQPMVAGDIHYPDGDVGVLLLVKPTLVGSEPTDVTQYRKRNASFPHESTGDQFYDEAQWESYRRLGLHAGRMAFGDLAAITERDGVGRAEKIFGEARRHWLPKPAGFDARYAGVVADMKALDARLMAREGTRSVQAVFPELELLAPSPPPANAAVASAVEQLAADLGIVREALLFMERVYHTEDLERRHRNPAYLGLFNYFRRWGQAPAVRRWWPVLRSLHEQSFVGFAERVLGLTAAGGARLGRIEVSDRAIGADEYGMRCWVAERGTPPKPELLAFDLCVDASGGPRLQVGHVRVTPEPAGVVQWSIEDYYIAPGFWGVGLGEAFLHRLTLGEGLPTDTRMLLVHMSWPRDRRAGDARSRAYLTQLYRSQGFREVAADDVHDSADLQHALASFTPRSDLEYRWMMRRQGAVMNS